MTSGEFTIALTPPKGNVIVYLKAKTLALNYYNKKIVANWWVEKSSLATVGMIFLLHVKEILLPSHTVTIVTIGRN